MEGSVNPENSNRDIEKLRSLWEEYKYRHDLVWRVIFQLTAAIVILSVIPYVNPDIVKIMKWGILGVPLLSIALIVFSFLLINNEMDLFQEIKDEYRRQQKALFPDIKHRVGCFNFRDLVTFFFTSIFLLSLANLIVIGFVWIPFHM
jgi:L-rhamnose mutarotase